MPGGLLLNEAHQCVGLRGQGAEVNKTLRPGGINVFFNAIISLLRELTLQLQLGLGTVVP